MVHYGKRIILALLAIALWATLPGCVNEFGEDGMPTGDEALVTISLSLPGAHMPDTRALTETDENQVSEIDVLVFDSSSSSGKYVYSTHCDDIESVQSSDNAKIFTVKLRQGTFDLAIVANAGSILSGVSLAGKTKAEALALLTTTGGKWITDSDNDSYRPIPMWGDIGAKTISESTDLTGTNAIALTRMVAKVDVTVDEEVDNFILTSVRVYNYNTSGVVAPTAAAWNSTSKKVTAPTVPSGSTRPETPLVYDNANGKTEINTTANSCTSEIYLFEANNFSSGTTPKDLTDRTCLVVGGKYEDDNDTTYYRMDFSIESENTQTYLNVLRNHRYAFNITKVSGSGYSSPEIAFNSAPVNIEAGVLSWNEAGMNNVAFDGQYMLSVNQNAFSFYKGAVSGEQPDNLLTIQTDYPDGWSATVTDTEGNTISNPWLTLSTVSTSAAGKTNVRLTLTQNGGSDTRQAVIRIAAGRLRYAVNVEQLPDATPVQDVMVELKSSESAVTGLLFAAHGTAHPAEQTLTVNWKPVDGDLTIVNTPGKPAFPDGEGTGTPASDILTEQNGTTEYTIQPAAFTEEELKDNPFAERSSTVSFMSTDGITYAAANVVLRQVAYNLVTDVANSYEVAGGTFTLNVRANFPWTFSYSDTDDILASVSSITSGGNNTGDGDAVTFTMAIGTEENSYLGKTATFTFTPTDGSGVTYTVEIKTPSAGPPLAPNGTMYMGMFGGKLTNNNGVWQFERPLYVQERDESTDTQWKKETSNTSETASDWDGKANTFAMNSDLHPAAYLCMQKNTETIDGVDDPNFIWYLPAQKQLMAAWVVQESFSSKFDTNYYWSATESSANGAWCVTFSNGTTNTDFKSDYCWVRCVREEN